MKLSNFLFAIVAIPSAAAAQVEANLDERLPIDPLVTIGTLDNGLRYYIRRNQRPENRAELRLVLNAGSVLEDDDQRGLAHVVEHMAFNGTESFPRQALVDYLEGIGMRFGPDVNAFTSFDETVYELQVPTDSAVILETAFKILQEWAHKVTFDPEQVESERGVVIEEWRLGRGARARMFDQQFPILFKDSQYANRLPIGTKDVLETFNHEALKRFYRDWYRPDLMAVVAVGDFDPARIEELVHEHFAQIPAHEMPRQRSIYPVPDHDETLIAIATDKEATTSNVSLYYKQALREETSVGAYRRLIIERLYNSMLNARLFERTQEADPPFLFGSSGQGRLIRSKEVYVMGAGVPEGGIERGLAALLTEAERVARHGFTPSELERHKIELLRRMERAYAEREKTNSGAYAFEYVSNFLTGEPIPGVPVEYELHKRFIPGIELAEVNRLASEWLSDQNRVILVSAPEKEGVRVPEEAALLNTFVNVQASAIDPYEDTVDDAPLISTTVTSGSIVSEELVDEIGMTSWTLSNGARVLLKPTDFKDDEILFRASSPGGTSLATDADFIAAETAATVVSAGGLGAFSLVDLQKKLAGKAVSLLPSIGELFESLSGNASPDDVEALFELIYLNFTAPRRDSAAYLAFRSQVNAVLANRGASPEAAFRDTLSNTLSRYHFRLRPPTTSVYEEMDLAKSFAFYRDRFADASDFTYVFVGSFEVDQLRPLAEKYLATLPSIQRSESWRDIGVRPPNGVVRRTVRRGIEPRAQTRIVFTGSLEYSRKTAHAIQSMLGVLQIKLRERLREDLGGTYGVSVTGGARRLPVHAYEIRVGFSSDPERLEELSAVVFAEIDKLKTEGPQAVDLQKVKESQRRSLETNLKENSFWIVQLISAARFGTDPREVLQEQELINGLTGAMVREAAEKYLRSDNYVQVSLYPERP